MSIGRCLSVDISGVWSERKARAVVEAFSDEARELGCSIEQIDVTQFGDLFPKVVLQLHCLEHGVPVPKGSACEVCLVSA